MPYSIDLPCFCHYDLELPIGDNHGPGILREDGLGEVLLWSLYRHQIRCIMKRCGSSGHDR